MPSIKKKEKSNSVSKRESTLELQFWVAGYADEMSRLEQAYSQLQNQFYSLKKQFEASHQTLEQIIMYMADGLIFISKEGLIELFNLAAEELTGFTAEKMVHTPFKDHFPDSFFGFSIFQALQIEGAHHRILLSLNDEKEIEVSTSSIPGRGVLLLLTDRTEQQKLEKSLSHSDRLRELGEMAAALAHEIRNPLGGIEGFAQLLKRDLSGPDHQKMIKSILEGTQTLNSLVTNVLEYARPLRLHFERIDLAGLVRDTINLMKAGCKGRRCKFLFSSELSEHWITADAGRLKLVLLNLLRNAFESNAKIVDIHLTSQGSLVIKDNGKGISQKNLEKIFTPFFTTKSSGTGLGLAEAQSVIKAHGGTIEVVSEEEKGTQFILTLSEKHAR